MANRPRIDIANATARVTPGDQRIQLDVCLELGADPICGTVTDATGPAVEFRGWIGLMSAFDNARLSARHRAAADSGLTDNTRSNAAP